MQANVVVVGSLNMDLVTRAQRLPVAGETLAGESFGTVPGGKGANQAVAAARLGAQVAMIGCVGQDAYGDQLRQALLDEGIDCQGVDTAADVSSGVALIVVDASSQNAIVIVAGGNGQLLPASVQRFDALLQAAEVIICQLEVPQATVAYTLARARALGKTVILNPAPATGPLPADWFAAIDYLIPNESEASALTGLPVSDLPSARAAATQLLAMGAGKVIVTLGAQGALFADAQGFQHFAAPVVQPVDTTAAGDTFVGGFAAALAQGKAQAEAIAFGQQAAALSVTRAGAQPSIPHLNELQGLAP
ncbi:ribokinase [Pseudomonas aegrilactucae]|uniref:Ribokinase n=1 Tax=Pseudomonas aegrilactucae TaxID=2854028 RepID=A0A9Q2XN49_9PSED|nr:ribokinase [Pseudomonas aegrilactucae]MBV6289329.1 ribokinase [Pseudomonas aegrilactucae]